MKTDWVPLLVVVGLFTLAVVVDVLIVIGLHNVEWLQGLMLAASQVALAYLVMDDKPSEDDVE